MSGLVLILFNKGQSIQRRLTNLPDSYCARHFVIALAFRIYGVIASVFYTGCITYDVFCRSFQKTLIVKRCRPLSLFNDCSIEVSCE